MSIADLPTVNATLNAISAFFLSLGYYFIRTKRISYHRICMLSACGASLLFFTSYLIYHYHTGSRHFTGIGLIRLIYFIILTTHTILAMVDVPLVIITLTRAFKGNFERHKKIARWTFPLWLYVSVTGVVVYFMLYHL
ncbi:MAG: DUF420 domain-containing protein [Calditrichaeota bacterium]|nr:MAG: DUF420 domain-containing protein [Calditrichota bacterium]